MPFTKGHKGFRTPESYQRAAIKIAANPNSAKTRFQKGSSGFTGKHTEETKQKIRIARARQGSNVWNRGTNLSSQLGLPRPLTTKIKIGIKQRGNLNHNWKGGITPLNLLIRRSIKYKIWRKEVFKRDNYTCVLCKVRGGKLEADHIKRFSDYPELRFKLSNGRTLCRDCHLETPTYGNRKQKDSFPGERAV